MKTLLHTFLFLWTFGAYAQEEFSFQLYFEDAAGNKDTVTVGYDANATNGIDVGFDEENIITQPWSNDFEIRVTDEYWKRVFYNSGSGTFHTKKQITGLNGQSSIIIMDMKSTNWPISVSWNSSVFTDSLNIGSFITTITYGMWGDLGVPVHYLSEESSLLLYPDIFDGVQSHYTIDNNTLYTLWMQFGSEGLLTLNNNILEKQFFSIYPNPADNLLYIEMENTELIFEKITIYDLLGRTVFQASGENYKINTVDIGNLKQGQYFLEIETANSLLQQKFIKN